MGSDGRVAGVESCIALDKEQTNAAMERYEIGRSECRLAVYGCCCLKGRRGGPDIASWASPFLWTIRLRALVQVEVGVYDALLGVVA